MKPKNEKRGAALVYVVIVTTMLLILAAVLAASVSYNIEQAARSVAGRQAYLTAKGAVDYARAYYTEKLKTAQNLSDLGLAAEQKIWYLPEAGSAELPYKLADASPAAGAQEAAVAKAEGGKLVINAAGKFRNYQGSKKLGYSADIKFAEKGKPANVPGSYFMVNGPVYGTHSVYDAWGLQVESAFLAKDISSDYPLLIKPAMAMLSTASGFSLAAPQMYFMGSAFAMGDINNVKFSIFEQSRGTEFTLDSPFIALANGVGGWHEDGSAETKVKIKNAGTMLYIAPGVKLCAIISPAFYNSLEFDSGDIGYYITLKDDLDLLDIAEAKSYIGFLREATAEEIKDISPEIKANLAFAMEHKNELKKVTYGGNDTDDGGTLWVGKESGRLKDGLPTTWDVSENNKNQKSWTYQEGHYDENSYVCAYIENAYSWGEEPTKWQRATYTAKEIVWMWGNEGNNDWTFSDEKTVIFNAEKISFYNGINNSVQLELFAGGEDAKLKVTNPKGSNENVLLYFPDTTGIVRDTAERVDVKGYYSIKSGTELFAMSQDDWDKAEGGGESVITSDEAGWTVKGSLNDGKPNGSTDKTYDESIVEAEVEESWISSNWENKSNVYRAGQINLKFDDGGTGPMEFPKKVSAAFKTNALRIDSRYGISRGDGAESGSGGKFIVRPLSGAGNVTVVFPADTTFYLQGNHEFTVKAGTYSIPSGTDLFEWAENAEDNWQDDGKDLPPMGGAGKENPGALEGGVYTNG